MRRFLRFWIAAASLSVPGVAQAIGSIDSPTAHCTKIKGNRCVINWGYIAVDASPNYMLDLWLFLEDELILHANGFFQTSMYLDNGFLREGLPVKCGNPGASSPGLSDTETPIAHGNSYSYTIRARDSANLKTANYGTVVCPPK